MPEINHIWDPVTDNILRETDENGDTVAVYDHEPDLYGNLISQQRDGQTNFHHFDALGSTRSLTDENEDITDTYLNDAWGVEKEHTGTTVNPWRWVGRKGYYWDEELAQYCVRIRSYRPSVARWSSVDSLHFLLNVSSYLYVGNGPLNGTDASGMLSDGQSTEVVACSLADFKWNPTIVMSAADQRRGCAEYALGMLRAEGILKFGRSVGWKVVFAPLQALPGLSIGASIGLDLTEKSIELIEGGATADDIVDLYVDSLGWAGLPDDALGLRKKALARFINELLPFGECRPVFKEYETTDKAGGGGHATCSWVVCGELVRPWLWGFIPGFKQVSRWSVAGTCKYICTESTFTKCCCKGTRHFFFKRTGKGTGGSCSSEDPEFRYTET